MHMAGVKILMYRFEVTAHPLPPCSAARSISSSTDSRPNSATSRKIACACWASRQKSAHRSFPTLRRCRRPCLDISFRCGWRIRSGENPKEIVDKMAAEIAKATRDPTTNKRYTDIKVDAVGSTPKQFDAYFRKQLKFNEDIIRSANIRRTNHHDADEPRTNSDNTLRKPAPRRRNSRSCCCARRPANASTRTLLHRECRAPSLRYSTLRSRLA